MNNIAYLSLPEIACRTFSGKVWRRILLPDHRWAFAVQGQSAIVICDAYLNEIDRIDVGLDERKRYREFSLTASPDGSRLAVVTQYHLKITDSRGNLYYTFAYKSWDSDLGVCEFINNRLLWWLAPDDKDRLLCRLLLIDVYSGKIVAQSTFDGTHEPYLSIDVISEKDALLEAADGGHGSQIYRVLFDGTGIQIVDYGFGDWSVYAISRTFNEFVSVSRSGDTLSFYKISTGSLLFSIQTEAILLSALNIYKRKDEEYWCHIDHVMYLDERRLLIKFHYEEYYQQEHEEYLLLDRVGLTVIGAVKPYRQDHKARNLRYMWSEKRSLFEEKLYFYGFSIGAPGELLGCWSDNTAQLFDVRHLLFPNKFMADNNLVQNEYQLSLFDHEN